MFYTQGETEAEEFLNQGLSDLWFLFTSLKYTGICIEMTKIALAFPVSYTQIYSLKFSIPPTVFSGKLWAW